MISRSTYNSLAYGRFSVNVYSGKEVGFDDRNIGFEYSSYISQLHNFGQVNPLLYSLVLSYKVTNEDNTSKLGGKGRLSGLELSFT